MKFLKIENNKGFYSVGAQSWKPIDEINKDDLFKLLDCALSDDFEMDSFCPEDIGNPAHRIIYKNIYEKLTDLNGKRDRFKDESETVYKEAIEKYSQ